MTRTNRRGFLTMASGTAMAAMMPAVANAAIPTPSATEGPFYPSEAMRFPDVDNDLVKIASAVREAGGEIARLSGRVLDQAGNPVAGARVEIWQCDVNGRYLHTGDRSGKPRDASFQGFGHYVTGEDGEYWFRTIKPVAYPGRTPHIHVKVLSGRNTLTTQMYIDQDPANDRDFLCSNMTNAQRATVAMQFQTGSNGIEAAVDIVFSRN
jgi:protocatechuate 3,4-dioxygenase beta subunit